MDSCPCISRSPVIVPEILVQSQSRSPSFVALVKGMTATVSVPAWIRGSEEPTDTCIRGRGCRGPAPRPAAHLSGNREREGEYQDPPDGRGPYSGKVYVIVRVCEPFFLSLYSSDHRVSKRDLKVEVSLTIHLVRVLPAMTSCSSRSTA